MFFYSKYALFYIYNFHALLRYSLQIIHTFPIKSQGNMEHQIIETFWFPVSQAGLHYTSSDNRVSMTLTMCHASSSLLIKYGTIFV